MFLIGEIINSIEAEKLIEERLIINEPNYVMSLKEYYLSNNSIQTTIIDARNYGCQARFINHSCQPNLCVLPVRINSGIPQAALFALRDIQTMEELSYDYNGSIDGKLNAEGDCVDESTSKYICFCGASRCRGYLPVNRF